MGSPWSTSTSGRITHHSENARILGRQPKPSDSARERPLLLRIVRRRPGQALGLQSPGKRSLLSVSQNAGVIRTGQPSRRAQDA
jgi:hypothetical protein